MTIKSFFSFSTAILFGALLTVGADANEEERNRTHEDNHFYDIERVICDGKEIPTPQNRPTLFYNPLVSILGIGKSLEALEGERPCHVTDFYTFLPTKVDFLENPKKRIIITFIPVHKIARRNSCEEEVLDFNGPSFQEGTLYLDDENDKITFKGFNGMNSCGVLVYEMSLRDKGLEGKLSPE